MTTENHENYDELMAGANWKCSFGGVEPHLPTTPKLW